MRGFTERLKKGRLALAVFGVVAALTGTVGFTDTAQARDHYGRDYRDHRGRPDYRWERDRRLYEMRMRDWRRYNYWRDDYGRRFYYAPTYYAPPPVYYAPPPRGYYAEPGVSFGLSFRN